MGTVHQLVESQNLFTVGSEQSVSEAARVLASNNIGALPVVADGRLVGILSERDIIQKIVAAGTDPRATTVEATMTATPVTVDATEPPTRALDLMKQNGCRHLPVLREGKLVGIVALRDLLQVQVNTQQFELDVLSALPDREFD